MKKFIDLAGHVHYVAEHNDPPLEVQVTRIKNSDTLPQKFMSWYQIYNEWVKLGYKTGDVFQQDENIHGQLYIYIFDMDFIKIKCFDEVSCDTFSVHDLNTIDRALSKLSVDYDREIINKISNLKSVKIRLNQF